MSLRGALATWQSQGDHDRDCHASLAMTGRTLAVVNPDVLVIGYSGLWVCLEFMNSKLGFAQKGRCIISDRSKDLSLHV
jgi:hypothetical protein